MVTINEDIKDRILRQTVRFELVTQRVPKRVFVNPSDIRGEGALVFAGVDVEADARVPTGNVWVDGRE